MSTIPVGQDVQQLAQGVQSMDGIDYRVVESQWAAEEGSAALASTANWASFGNNPAGLKYSSGSDSDSADSLAYGTDSNGFLLFRTPSLGAEAYGLRYRDPIYQSVITATHSGDPQQEITAIYESPWDTGHYQGNSNVRGYNLMSAYAALSGSTLSAEVAANEASNSQAAGGNAGSVAAKTVGDALTGLYDANTGNGSSITSSAQNAIPGVGLASGSAAAAAGNINKSLGGIFGNYNLTQLLILAGGTVLAILLMYRTVTR